MQEFYNCSFKDQVIQNYFVYDAIKHEQDIIYNHVLWLITA